MTTKRPRQYGDGLKVERNIVKINTNEIHHDDLQGVLSNQHIDWTDAEADFFTKGSVTIEGDVNFNTDSVFVSNVAYTVHQVNGFKWGQVIRWDGESFQLASSASEETAESIGIIVHREHNLFRFVISGYIELNYERFGLFELASLEPNTMYYLGDSPGTLLTAPPTTEGYVSKPVIQTFTNNKALVLQHRGIVIEKLVKDEDDMASDSDTHMATQQSIKAYSDANLAEAKSYTDDELTDYASDTVTFTNKTIDADNNTLSNLEHGAELDAPVAGTGVTHGHISDASQTIAGEKTFSTFPITPSAAPDADYEVANKKYVDDNIVDNTDITKEPTGFTAPEDVIINYDSTTRKITLTGTVNAYYRGEQVSALTSGWVSDAHADVAGVYFLIYDGSSFSWLDLSTTTSDFAYLLIAYVRYDATNSWALRECHGVMPWQTHKELHDTVGTYKDSGGTLGDYTLESSTAADRRPSISATVLYDEDLPTTNPALTAGSYTQYYLSSSDTANFATAEPDIVPLSGTQPYWNEYSGGTWGQTLLSNNDYMAVWVIAIPTTADTASQNYRFIFAQGQQQSANLEDIQALTPNDYTVGELSQLTPESVFIAKIIIKYQGGDWNLVEVNALTGTRLSQASSPTGSYLSSVSTTSPITGTGSATSPVDLDIATLTEKSTLADDDLFLIEDSEASNAPKKVKKSSLGSGSSNVEDGTADGQMAYWDNTAGEYKHTDALEFDEGAGYPSLDLTITGTGGLDVTHGITIENDGIDGEISLKHDYGNHFKCASLGWNYIVADSTSITGIDTTGIAKFNKTTILMNDDYDDIDFTIRKETSGDAFKYDAGTDELIITPTTLDFFGDADITSVSTGTSDNDKLVTQGYVDDEIAGISSGTDFLEVQVFT